MDVLKIANDYSYFLSDNIFVKKDLWNRLRFRDKNYFHNRAYKMKKWDGFINFFDEDSGKFLTGILPEICAVLKHHNVEYTIDDTRQFTQFQYQNIDDQFLNQWLAKDANPVNLYDYQVELINQVIKHRRGIIFAPTGCHAKGTLLPTFNGEFILVENIKKGDKLIGINGEQRTVSDLFKGTDEMYEICPKKGKPFTVNQHHILTLMKYKTNEIIDVKVKDWLNWSNKRKSSHYLFRTKALFSEKKLPLDSYLLGILLGDGCLRDTPNVTNSRIEIINAVAEQINLLGLKIVKYKSNIKSPTYSFCGKSGHKNKLTEILKKLNLHKTTSANKFIPLEFKTSNENERLKLLAGLIDTDGCISTDKSCFCFTSESEILANDVCFVSKSCGLTASVKTFKNKKNRNFQKNYFRVTIGGNIHEIPTIIKICPKQNKRNCLKSGFSVKYVGQGEYFGFSLLEEPHYLTDDFFVTHNSGKTNILTGILKCIQHNTPTLILANKKSLVEQNYDELIKWQFKNVGRLYGKYNTPNIITVSTFQSVHKIEKFLPKYKVLLVDEIHDATSKIPKIVYKKTKLADIRIGISATPFKFGGKDNVQKFTVKGFFGPIFKIKSTTKNGVLTTSELQDRGILSSSECTFYPIREPQIPHDIFIDAVTRGIAESYHFHKIVTRLAKLQKGRTLILVDRIAHGDALHSLLPNSLWIQGKDDLETRKEVIKQLQTSEGDVIGIATQQIFNTGINVHLHNLINAGGGQADHLIIQRMGRGLRTAKDKETLNYYDFVFEINSYLKTHSEKRIKILEKEGHKIQRKEIDF